MIEAIDEQSLKRIAGGDTSIFEHIYSSYYPEIRRFIYFRVSNDQLSEDLTSGIFLRFFEYVTRGNVINHVRGFLFRSAKNEIANYYRDRKEVVDIEEIITDEIAEETNISDILDFQIDMEKAIAAIQKIKSEWRDLILMRFLKDLEYNEIAKITGKSEVSIRVTIHRAVKELREILKQL